VAVAAVVCSRHGSITNVIVFKCDLLHINSVILIVIAQKQCRPNCNLIAIEQTVTEPCLICSASVSIVFRLTPWSFNVNDAVLILCYVMCV